MRNGASPVNGEGRNRTEKIPFRRFVCALFLHKMKISLHNPPHKGFFDTTERGERKSKIMPIYEYYCPANDSHVEVYHSIKARFTTWGDLCAHAQLDPGTLPPDSPVERLVYPGNFNTPKGNSDLKNMGFTKLVKRDDGVYENVTATGGEKRYMTKGDASSVPHIHKKISD